MFHFQISSLFPSTWLGLLGLLRHQQATTQANECSSTSRLAEEQCRYRMIEYADFIHQKYRKCIYSSLIYIIVLILNLTAVCMSA